MVKNPILINRPIVVTPLGVKLCRPSETVLRDPARRSGVCGGVTSEERMSETSADTAPDCAVSACSSAG